MNNNNRNNSNNNSNNNRRRGRPTRPGGGSGGGNGGQQLNRIDSRARGNAPQLLEKYRKLAGDAHLNGDRVQAEYYLQFADHYFRVLADQRVRLDEQRLRREDRWEGGAEESADDAAEFTVESDFPSFDQPTYQRREREDRPRDDSAREDRPKPERSPDRAPDRGQDRAPDRQREDRPRQERPRDDRPRDDRPRESRPRVPREATGFNRDSGESRVDAVAPEAPAQSSYEPAENPFVRDSDSGSGGRGLRPRRNARPEPGDRPRRNDADDAAGDATGPRIDPSILPPAIALPPADLAADDLPPVKRPRGRPRKVVDAAPDSLAAAEQD